MTDTQKTTDPTASTLATDLQDERLQQRHGVRGWWQGFIDRVRAGDLGTLPVIGGLIVIWIVFQILNPIFLSSRNLENLLMASVVITLAGLLAFLGVQLYILGAQGSINIPFNSVLVKFAQSWFVPEWLSYVFAVIAGGGYFISQYLHAQQRSKAGLSAKSR